MMIGKKHLVLAGLLIALGAAVYLNWQFAPTDTVVDTAGSEQNYTEDGYVMVSSGLLSGSDTPADAQLTDEEEAVEAALIKSSFDKAREEREDTREEALETLRDILDDASLSESQKADAVSTAAKIAENMDTEASIEMLIKAKGYKDCVVVISDSQVNVVLPAISGGLQASDIAIIRDIVVGQMNISPSSIKIIEAK